MQASTASALLAKAETSSASGSPSRRRTRSPASQRLVIRHHDPNRHADAPRHPHHLEVQRSVGFVAFDVGHRDVTSAPPSGPLAKAKACRSP